MQQTVASKQQITMHSVCLTYLTALVMVFTTSLPQSSHAARLTPPAVPANLQVPAGNTVFLKGHAVGTQQYVCLKPGAPDAWKLFGPQATLFQDNGKQSLTHFLSPNPDESDLPRPTWQDSKHTSAVWAKLKASSTDPRFVAPGAIPWFLLEVVGSQDGWTGHAKLAAATFIHRVYTSGGMAPSSGCAVPTDIGTQALVEYEADYYFYMDTRDEREDDH